MKGPDLQWVLVPMPRFVLSFFPSVRRLFCSSAVGFTQMAGYQTGPSCSSSGRGLSTSRQNSCASYRKRY